MTTWLEAVRWAICLGAGVKACHGYRRRKLSQQAWDRMLATAGPGCESGDHAWLETLARGAVNQEVEREQLGQY